MGADAFYVCYGVRLVVDADDAPTTKALELRRHPWQVRAKNHGLDFWWGDTVDERQCFALIGRLVGQYGWEGEPYRELSGAEVDRVVTETAERLLAAGIEGQPAWHFQFEPDR